MPWVRIWILTPSVTILEPTPSPPSFYGEWRVHGGTATFNADGSGAGEQAARAGRRAAAVTAAAPTGTAGLSASANPSHPTGDVMGTRSAGVPTGPAVKQEGREQQDHDHEDDHE